MKTKQQPSGTLNNRPKSVRPLKRMLVVTGVRRFPIFRTLDLEFRNKPNARQDQLMSVNNGWMPEKIQQTNCHKLFDLSLRTNETKH